MTDKELFNHFKTRSTTFDELPGEDLWIKIEKGLDNTKPTGKSNIILFIICGIVLTTSIILYFSSTGSTVKISPVTEPVTTTSPEHKAITTTKPPLNVLPATSTATQTGTLTQTETIVKSKEEIIGITHDSVKKVKVRTAKIQPVATTDKTVAEPYVKFMSNTKGAIAPLEESLTFEVQKKETPGNIIISTKQKITTAEYQKLIEDMLKEHKTSTGAVLTIKAPGHKPFRQKITESNLTTSPNRDSLTLSKSKKQIPETTQYGNRKKEENIAVEYTTAFTPNDTLKLINQEIITFKGSGLLLDNTVADSTTLTKQPEFPGGWQALLKEINKHFYTPDIKKNMSAKILVSFIVETDGTMSSFKILKDPGHGLGNEAVKAIKAVNTKWIPAEIKEKQVRTSYVLPITVIIKS